MLSSPYTRTIVTRPGRGARAIARLLLDALDRWPPSPGDWCVVYLLYNTSDVDAQWFSSKIAANEVCDHLIESYEDETKLLAACGVTGNKVLGWRFELAPGVEPDTLMLRSLSSRGAPAATVEIVFAQLDKDVRPDELGLAIRSQPLLDDEEQLVAVVEAVDESLRMGRHVDCFQRGIRWKRRVLYLTKRWNSFRVGPHPTCELLAESLGGVLAVTFDFDRQKWRVEDLRDLSIGRQEAPYSPKLTLANGDRVMLRGELLPSLPTFKEQSEANRLPVYDLLVVSRLLPVGPGHGYGYVSDNLARRFGSSVHSCIRLSLEESYFYVNDQEQMQLLRQGETWPFPVSEGDEVRIDGALATWRRFPPQSEPELRNYFLGQLEFQNPPTVRLASGAFSVDLREAFFEHHDELQRHARLSSEAGSRFRLDFVRDSDANLVWVKPGKERPFELRSAVQVEWVISGAFAEFVVGTTRFCVSDSPRAVGETGGV